ncbi:hypothetical protein WMY93_019585 [Mugilogobius chulae]|uniref:Guanine nucleotide-binding protein subunit beta-like protein n=1 Tax=Mugilogobius chulae TaxID=88201 RepID=A0AAW0NJ96_9GOBI
MGLVRTLNCFQREWHQSSNHHKGLVPDALTQQALLKSELVVACEEVALLQGRILDLHQTMVRLQREQDFHREQSVCVEAEKRVLWKNLTQLREHEQRLEPALTRLTQAHQAAFRVRTRISMETKHLQREAEQLQRDDESGQCTIDNSSALRNEERGFKTSGLTTETNEIKMTKSQRTRCNTICKENQDGAKLPDKNMKTRSTHFTLTCSFRAHRQPISNVEVHPVRRLLASSSDDRTWRLWKLPNNEEKVVPLLLSADGHSDWLTSCSFSSDGDRLATTSGDTTVCVWDVHRGHRLLSLVGHSSSTWGCAFHRSGLSLASASSDRNVRLWDLSTGRALCVLRRHGNAVSWVHFLPQHEHFLLSSGRDGALVLWDVRTRACHKAVQGHKTAVNHCTADDTGLVLASCDVGGVVSLWDVRSFHSPLFSIHTAVAANQVSFCPGGSEEVAVAGGDEQVRVLRPSSSHVTELSGHVGKVCSVRFDHQGDTLLSAGADGLVRVWRRSEQ